MTERSELWLSKFTGERKMMDFVVQDEKLVFKRKTANYNSTDIATLNNIALTVIGSELQYKMPTCVLKLQR